MLVLLYCIEYIDNRYSYSIRITSNETSDAFSHSHSLMFTHLVYFMVICIVDRHLLILRSLRVAMAWHCLANEIIDPSSNSYFAVPKQKMPHKMFSFSWESLVP